MLPLQLPRVRSRKRSVAAAILATLALASSAALAADAIPNGRFDATLIDGPDRAPAWFEITGGGATPTVVFQGPAGGRETCHEVLVHDGHLVFATSSLGTIDGTFDGDRFDAVAGERHVPFSAVRAPELPESTAVWGAPEVLFDGRTLAGWGPRWPNRTNGWVVYQGALLSVQPTNDLVSLKSYRNFRLHLEYRLHVLQDSGVHLRGRYEIQLSDHADLVPSEATGSVYGCIAPRVAAARPVGQWNTLDVELVGRRLTARLNGKWIHDRVRLDGITGDALDSNEGEPGPIVLQGHLGMVEFRRITVTPAR